jgi:hypothetical protein
MVRGVPGSQVPPELQVSAPLQTLPSEQLVPAATGVCFTPLVGSQASVVQGLPSSMVRGVPGSQVPPELQVSAPLQTLLSEQLVPAATGVCFTPFVGSQASVVQGLPSSTVRGVPGWQVPLKLQVSAPLQTLPSEQLVPAATLVWVTPFTGSQASVVQGLPSSTVRGVPGWQVPLELQVSVPLQTLPSEQLVPVVTFVCVTPVVGSQASVVQGLPSSTVGGVPGSHVPLELQVSAPLQTLPSEQLVPAATFVWVTPFMGSQASVVQGLPSSTVRGVPGWQVPLELQVSAPLQTLPSGQAVPVGLLAKEQVPSPLQVPA